MNTSAAQAAGESVEQKIARLERELAAAIEQRDKLEKALIEVIGNLERTYPIAFRAIQECGK